VELAGAAEELPSGATTIAVEAEAAVGRPLVERRVDVDPGLRRHLLREL